MADEEREVSKDRKDDKEVKEIKGYKIKNRKKIS